MIGFTVIGGYLAAGKTTLLNRILNGQHGVRFALIINDFGTINIDADLIESKTDSQVNLTNGCVCCSLTDGLHEALEQFQEMEPPPEHIIIEASGVADVGNIAQYGRAPGLQLDGILVLADAETMITKATDKYVAGTIKRQLSIADLIILNKTDLLDEAELTIRRDWLSHHYPEAVVIEARHADVPLELLMGVHGDDKLVDDVHIAHAHYQTWSYTAERKVEPGALEAFSKKLPGFVLRAKGFVGSEEGSLCLQVVGNRREVSKVGPATSHSIIAIGLRRDFDANMLDQLASKYLA